MRVVSLASGSTGNSLLVTCGETILLVDCGLPTAAVEGSLATFGVDPHHISAILVTHSHSDHIRSAGVMSRRYGIPLVANRPTLDGAGGYLGKVDWRALADGSCQSIGDAEVASFPVLHDAAGTVGYLIAHQGSTLCAVTDVGAVTPEVIEALELADLIVLEANHDVEMLRSGPYPALLKKRILSDHGHLSNESAAGLLAGLSTGKQRWVWLAHLSKVNNSPSLARRSIGRALARNGVRNIKLEVALRDRPSVAWDSALAYYQSELPGITDLG